MLPAYDVTHCRLSVGLTICIRLEVLPVHCVTCMSSMDPLSFLRTYSLFLWITAHASSPALWEAEAGRSRGQEFTTSQANMKSRLF